MWALIGSAGIQLLTWFLSRQEQNSKEAKEMWQNFQIFIKSVDAWRSVKVHQDRKKLRDEFKDL